MEIEKIVRRIGETDGCRLSPPAGLPTLDSVYRLPEDVATFYKLCGGATLFERGLYKFEVFAPTQFRLSNVAILGERIDGDISSSWYVIAREGDSGYVSVDLSPERLGRCYDSFWDRHAVPGSSPIIALSFTSFLDCVLRAKGEYLFWLKADFVSLGDAYD